MVAAALVALLAFVYGVSLAAHDIPADVTVQVLVRPEGQRLRVVVRVPLQSMRDMDYPKPRDATNADLLDLSRADATLRDAATLWISDDFDVYENGEALPAPRVAAVRAALQSDKSFVSYDDAIAHLTAPGLPAQTEFSWSQGLLDVLFEYPIRSDQSRFSVQPRLARLGIRTLTVLRYLPPAGGVRAFEFLGDPGVVQMDPLWRETTTRFIRLGFRRLLDGPEYLLFLIALVIPFRRIGPIAAVAGAFAVAHSITLLASASSLASDALWFPPLVDTLIAASVVYMALENILFVSQMKPMRPVSAVSPVSSETSLKRRWIATFAFGLAHGFALSFALRPALQLAGSHTLTAMVAFNIGVELALLLVLALLIPAVALVFRYLIGERTGIVVVSALAGHTAWHWMDERWDLLRKFTFEWPTIDAALLAGALRWTMLLVAAGALYWLLFGVLAPNVKSRQL
jgi:HupE/UreJ protein